MNTLRPNDDWNNSFQNSSTVLNTSLGNNPLQTIADRRFHAIVIRALNRNRVTPELHRPATGRSELSSWSSASVVSSIDLESPEPPLDHNAKAKFQALSGISKFRRFFMVAAFILICLIVIAVIISIVLVLTLKTNSNAPTATVPNSSTTI